MYLSVIRKHNNLKLPILCWSTETYTSITSWGEFNRLFRGHLWQNLSTLVRGSQCHTDNFGRRRWNTTSDHCLIESMTSGKSTYALLILYFTEEEATKWNNSRGHVLVLTLSVRSYKQTWRWNQCFRFSNDHPPHKRRETSSRAYLPWVIYARLDECVNNILRSIGRYDIVTHTDTCFLQIFLWERYGAIAP